MRPRDTSLDAAQRQIDAYRSMTPQRRVELADAMSTEVRDLVRAGVRSRHPEFNGDAIDAAVNEIFLGAELAAVATRRASAR